MSSKFDEIAVLDSNKIVNEIMRDIVDNVESVPELSSEDLFRIDCAILSTLRKTEDFSRDLLKQLESGMLKTPQRDVLQDIQQEAIMDITLPLQDLFDEMAVLVCEALN